MPFLSQALRSGGHVVIDRGQRVNAMQAITAAAEQVKTGKTVLIFPEGTRGDCDTVGAFKKGGFYLAKEAGVPILPVGLRGSRSVFPRSSMLVHPGKIEVHIGRPLPPDEIAQSRRRRDRAARAREDHASSARCLRESAGTAKSSPLPA